MINMNKVTDIPSSILLHLTVFVLSKTKTKQKVATTISKPVINNNLKLIKFNKTRRIGRLLEIVTRNSY